MFNVLSGEFTLTLQSSPPFVVESAFALALAVLLAAPLIASVHFFLVGILHLRDDTVSSGAALSKAHEKRTSSLARGTAERLGSAFFLFFFFLPVHAGRNACPSDKS